MTQTVERQSSEQALGSPSVTARGEPVHETHRGALVCHVATATTVVADHEGASHAVTAHMANLVAGPADHITVATMEGSTTTTEGSNTATEGRRSTPLIDCIRFGALTGQMASNIAQIANRIIGAITGNMATLPTVVAGLLIGAFLTKVPWFVAVAAENHFSRQHWRSSAVSCNVARIATVVTYPFVPADIFGRTLSSNVPAKSKQNYSPGSPQVWQTTTLGQSLAKCPGRLQLLHKSL
uniref:DNA-binding protein HEXBP n=1 Tax=Arundo donax TaxID=35708 RepID=A0A0A9A5G9_ARUDO